LDNTDGPRSDTMSKNNLVVERDKLQFTMSRVFNAPRDIVWKVCNSAAHIPNWWGPRRYATIVDKMDFRVGGAWRFINRDADGNEFAFNGIYKVIDPPKRLTYTFEFEPMPGHISTDDITFEEVPGGKTRLFVRTTFTSLEDLDGMLQSGMEAGATETWDRLEELVAKEAAAAAGSR
jgi:uncharacterized protein YndB with AHSA1/START domain